VKKTIKVISILIFVAFMLVVLTGCRGNSNRIVATRDIDQMGLQVSERLEITFRDDVVYSITATYEFDSEENAMEYYAIMTMMLEGEDISHSGTTVTMTLTADDLGEGATREEVIRDLEEDGYTIR